jgi:hypothetical protein
MEAVITALRSDPTGPKENWSNPPSAIYLVTEATDRSLSLTNVLRPDEVTPWKGLPASQQNRVQTAAKEAVHRAESREQLQYLVSSDPDIVLCSKKDKEAWISAEPAASRWRRRIQFLHTYPPGYTSDQKLAVVHLDFAWAINHVGDATFVLERQNEIWSVQMRQYHFYV